MSSRSRAAANLAYHLNDKVGLDVSVGWDNPSGRPGHGAWRVEWTDGPTIATMRGHAENLVRYCRPLTTTMLCFSRFTTAKHGSPRCSPSPTTTNYPNALPWPSPRPRTHSMAPTPPTGATFRPTPVNSLSKPTTTPTRLSLVHATVTKPRDETPPQNTLGACQHCTTPLAPARPGRPPTAAHPAGKLRTAPATP
jgi:hypothetical protein